MTRRTAPHGTRPIAGRTAKRDDPPGGRHLAAVGSEIRV